MFFKNVLMTNQRQTAGKTPDNIW